MGQYLQLLVHNSILLAVTVLPSILNADQQLVQFDLPASVAATSCSDPELVSVELRLSSMIESAALPAIKQWMVRCLPRDQAVSIADYAPRTETGSDLATPIQVKKIAEESQSAGLSIDGSYSHLTRANLGADRGKKHSNSIQFDQVAPVQAVTAAGTIERGRGVYFKLRWTATQVLEGEKVFHITMRVPPAWRGGLLDVSVIAQAESKSLAPWDRQPETIGSANFVVAAYRAGDNQAEYLARSISRAEQKLRQLSSQQSRQSKTNSLPTVLRQMAATLDFETQPDLSQWVQRLLHGDADPYFDKQIRKLPMPVRVAVLDYVDLRDDFNEMRGKANQSVIAAKPPL